MPRWRRDEFDDINPSGDESYADQFQEWDQGDFAWEEHRRRGTGRRLLGCLLPVVVVAGVGFGGWKAYEYLGNYFGGETCLLRGDAGEEKLDPEQAANASTISTVATQRMNLPPKAAHLGLSTAIQESKLRNLTGGDRDSIGLFQQRPSQGWGTAEQINDPVYSASAFYDVLIEVDSWQTRPLTEVAQEVQRSGHPDAYADHDTEGDIMSDALTGATTEGVGCRLDPAADGDPAQVATTLREQTGHRGQTSASGVTVTLDDARSARTIAAWGVTHAAFEDITTVTLGDREWKRQRGRDGWSWHAASDPTGSDRVVRITVK
ncbi:hypothetical protein [Demetria terragena]|uniref:hypothetical protein n=1 Tax=Demetria terragena TaxID=63959 RepID=UPI000375840D|nr:hypothetical protein [Demetria terragena]